MSNEKAENKNQKSKPIVWIILLLVAIGGAVYLFLQLGTVKEALVKLELEKEHQRVELKKELDSLLGEHTTIKAEYGELSDSLAVKDAVIQENAKEIKRLLNTEWEYYKIKKKLNNLRKITQGYLQQMDSLYTVNGELVAENKVMREKVKTTQSRVSALEIEKDEADIRIAKAAIFKGYDINIGPYRTKGSGKRVFTDKARKMKGIQILLTLGDNSLISNGSKMIYARISGPDKKVLCKGDGDNYTFELDGNVLQYSLKQSFNYTGQPVELKMFWNKVISSQEFEAGSYSVDLYVDGYKVTTRTFDVK